MKANRIFVGAGLLVLPFIFSFSGEQMRQPKAQIFACMAGLFLSYMLAKRVSLALGTGAALCYISAALTRMFPAQDLLIFSAALGSCLIIADPKEDDVKHFLEMLELSALLCACYAMLLQYPGLDPFLRTIEGHDFKRVPAFFGQHTLYGPFCVAGFASALLRKRFYRSFLLATPIVFIDASFTYLAAGAVIAIFLIMEFHRKALIGMALCGILGLTILGYIHFRPGPTPEALNDNGRFPLWKMTYAIAKSRPFMGHGFGGFAQQFPAFQVKEIREANGIKDEMLSPQAQKMLEDGRQLYLRSGIFVSPHNEFLWAFYDLGYPGLIIALWCVLSFVWCWFYGGRSLEDWALLAIFLSFIANSLGNFPFHLIPQALIPLWSYVAVTSRSRGCNVDLCLIARRKIMSFSASKTLLTMLDWLLALRQIRRLREFAAASIGRLSR